MLCNYDHLDESCSTEPSEILLAASHGKKNHCYNLNSVMLGKIVKEIWGETVKVVRRGPRTNRRSVYLNLRRREDVTYLPNRETFEQFRKTGMVLDGGWTKISDNPNIVSFIRCESWYFNNQRVSVEVGVTEINCTIRYTLISHGCKMDLANIMDIESLQQYPLTVRNKLILAFIDNGHLCRGAAIEDGESTALPHTIGNYVDCRGADEGASNNNVEETRIFSEKCLIICVNGICCVNCKKVKHLCTRAKRRKLERDTIHPHTNKRYLAKSEVLHQIAYRKKGVLLERKIHFPMP